MVAAYAGQLEAVKFLLDQVSPACLSCLSCLVCLVCLSPLLLFFFVCMCICSGSALASPCTSLPPINQSINHPTPPPFQKPPPPVSRTPPFPVAPQTNKQTKGLLPRGARRLPAHAHPRGHQDGAHQSECVRACMRACVRACVRAVSIYPSIYTYTLFFWYHLSL